MVEVLPSDLPKAFCYFNLVYLLLKLLLMVHFLCNASTTFDIENTHGIMFKTNDKSF